VTILGISAFYHDSATALIKDGKILSASQEERFSRKKHDPGFPSGAIASCLKIAKTTLSDVDAVVFYDKPFLKFERLLYTYYSFAPRGLRSFLMSIPIWIKEKLLLKKLLRDALHDLRALHPVSGDTPPPLLFSEHHLSHAASTFYTSPSPHAAILTIDGVGEWATASISEGRDNRITPLREMNFLHSIGLFYLLAQIRPLYR